MQCHLSFLIRPQFTQVSSAESFSKENSLPQSWHDFIFLAVNTAEFWLRLPKFSATFDKGSLFFFVFCNK